jgi:mono/diheme cytochrome c family protein
MQLHKIISGAFGIAAIAAMVSCGAAGKDKTGHIYMPDMAYSRAVETYADHSNLKDKGIYYDATPVAGTVKRGDIVGGFTLAMDKTGDTANYFASRQIANPVTSLAAKELLEAARLYRVNCGICHGEKLDGNGPLYNGGNGKYPAKPATLVGDAKYENMPAGQMMYSLTYGKNLMGSYASQLSTKQRWDIIYYIKQLQTAGKAPAAADTTKAVN